MKKIYMFFTLFLAASLIFAQSHKLGNISAKNTNIVAKQMILTPSAKAADTDTLTNIRADDTLTVYTLTGQWGYVSGHNGYQMSGFAEKFTNTLPGDVNGVLFYPYKAYAANPSNTITFKVYADGITPGTALATKTVAINTLTPDAVNDITFDTPVAVTGNFYIGYEITYNSPVDTFCTYMATFTNPNRTTNTAYLNYSGSWYAIENLFSGAPKTSYAVMARFAATVATTPTPSLNANTWNFGTVQVGNTSTSNTFTLSNIGSDTLTVSAVNGLSGTPFTCSLVPANVNLTTGQTATFTFTYTPTTAGTQTATATIVTNGGDVTVSLTGTAITCSAINSFPWTESFEGTEFPPTCWTNLDQDGDTYAWEKRTASGDGWRVYDGDVAAVSASWVNSTVGPVTPNNYLITPQLSIPNANMMLKFHVAPQDPAYPGEHFSVEVSTTGNTAADFTSIYNYTLTTPDTIFKEVTLPLSAYNGQSIYIAIRHFNVTDMFYMILDKVEVYENNSINTNDIKSNIFVYPNPATTTLTVANENALSIEIFNLNGQKVAEYNNTNTANVADLAQGTYMVKVVTNNNVTTQKINIVR